MSEIVATNRMYVRVVEFEWDITGDNEYQSCPDFMFRHFYGPTHLLPFPDFRLPAVPDNDFIFEDLYSSVPINTNLLGSWASTGVVICVDELAYSFDWFATASQVTQQVAMTRAEAQLYELWEATAERCAAVYASYGVEPNQSIIINGVGAQRYASAHGGALDLSATFSDSANYGGAYRKYSGLFRPLDLAVLKEYVRQLIPYYYYPREDEWQWHTPNSVAVFNCGLETNRWIPMADVVQVVAGGRTQMLACADLPWEATTNLVDVNVFGWRTTNLTSEIVAMPMPAANTNDYFTYSPARHLEPGTGLSQVETQRLVFTPAIMNLSSGSPTDKISWTSAGVSNGWQLSINYLGTPYYSAVVSGATPVVFTVTNAMLAAREGDYGPDGLRRALERMAYTKNNQAGITGRAVSGWVPLDWTNRYFFKEDTEFKFPDYGGECEPPTFPVITTSGEIGHYTSPPILMPISTNGAYDYDPDTVQIGNVAFFSIKTVEKTKMDFFSIEESINLADDTCLETNLSCITDYYRVDTIERMGDKWLKESVMYDCDEAQGIDPIFWSDTYRNVPLSASYWTRVYTSSVWSVLRPATATVKWVERRQNELNMNRFVLEVGDNIYCHCTAQSNVGVLDAYPRFASITNTPGVTSSVFGAAFIITRDPPATPDSIEVPDVPRYTYNTYETVMTGTNSLSLYPMLHVTRADESIVITKLEDGDAATDNNHVPRDEPCLEENYNFQISESTAYHVGYVDEHFRLVAALMKWSFKHASTNVITALDCHQTP